ncbi:Hemolysin, contains CBS domains [Halorubrum vacuolatum]|uniref:Hemolysin, contains CBS domains n=1 Tax=Halorubrum vacuolatum TaxID=63740 RepID=A0A238XXE2_HALVU|nr:Hemolysin, contains CBS domains [Halorubrum vacuolatum]
MDLTITLFGFAAIVVLTAVSAFFSSSELAVFSVAKHRVDSLVATDVPGAAALATLRADPHRFLVTALVSNNVANIAAASVATAVLVQFLPPSQAATGSTLFTSFFVIVFGEIAPKSYAVANAEKHALRVSRPVVVAQRLLRPILLVFEVASGLVNRVTGGETEIESYLTREEIETIVLSGEETGALDPDESAMIRGVLDLEATTVTAVMVPRTDMVAVSETAAPDDVLSTAASEGVTRMPVYGENRDDVVGIVDVRDAIRAVEAGEGLESVLREPTFVPETKSIDELFEEMRDGAVRMVVVVDEFGAVSGIATLEDVVEEVVGEIVGPYETEHVRVVDGETAIVRGWTTVAYLNGTLALTLPTDGDFETVAGLITAALGRLPEEGDRVHFGDVTLVVTAATPTRVTRVRVEHGAGDVERSGEGTDAGTAGPSEPSESSESSEPSESSESSEPSESSESSEPSESSESSEPSESSESSEPSESSESSEPSESSESSEPSESSAPAARSPITDQTPRRAHRGDRPASTSRRGAGSRSPRTVRSRVPVRERPAGRVLFPARRASGRS